MPAFGTPQAGAFGPPNQGLNVVNLGPGDIVSLFDGTETPALNLASVAFSRGYSAGVSDNGTTFNISGIPAGMTVDVQVCSPPAGGFSSVAAMNAAFSSVITLTADANGNASYTDVGRSQFYRLLLSAFTTGAMCVGVASR
jgi:hypothetical protein